MAIREILTPRTSGSANPSGAGASGSQAQVMSIEVPVSADDASGDVLFVAPLSGDIIPLEVTYFIGGVTGLSDVNVGFYKSQLLGGTAIDDNVFDDGVDMSSAATTTGLTAVGRTDRAKTIRELCGSAESLSEYTLALNLQSEPTAAGTIVINMLYAQA